MGKDFKNTFDDLSQDLDAQQSKADGLRRQLSNAGAALLKANEEHSARLEEVAAQEKAQAAQDRVALLSEITCLVNRHGEKQDKRWEDSVLNMQQEITSSKEKYQSEELAYNDGMDQWLLRGRDIQSCLQKRREEVKQRIKEDWATANEHTTGISETTRSVHEETIRIVDAQMANMDEQLSALDEILSRVRAQNSNHHDAHVESLARLGHTVKQSYLSIAEYMGESADRTQAFSGDVHDYMSETRAAVEPLTQNVQVPLAELRCDIISSSLGEYAPTGMTPQKAAYSYPKSLPRTRAHDKLVANFRGQTVPESPEKPRQKQDPLDITDLTNADDILRPRPTCSSKGEVFTDAAPADEGVAYVASPPGFTREHTSRPASASGPDRGLREVDINIAEVNTTTRSGRKDLARDTQARPYKKQNVEGTFSQSVGPGSKPGKRMVIGLAEGRENVPLAASGGNGRVLRARKS